MGEREGVVIELLPCIDLEILLHFLFFDNFEEKNTSLKLYKIIKYYNC